MIEIKELDLEENGLQRKI